MREIAPLVRSLYEIDARNDRAALAELRRSLSNPIAALPYVVPFLPKDASEWHEHSYTLVAGLFALHPSSGALSLASALRRISDASDSVALRFRALLDSHPEDVGTHMRHAISLVRSHDLALDYDDLFRTILAWGRDDRRAQRAWARDFWGTVDGTTASSTSDTSRSEENAQ